MPIKPENRKKYGKNWGVIRSRILERARGRCEVCGVLNRDFGYRDDEGTFHPTARLDGNGDMIWIEDPLEMEIAEMEGRIKIIQIVLTIAHWDHDPTNHDPDNLKAVCQKCHFAHDREDNARKRADTRREKGRNLELFE